MKKQNLELRFAQVAPDVWGVLGALKRTGWVRRGVKNPESVQEHTISLRRIAASLEGLSERETEGLLDMLEVHDWPEAVHGDEVAVSMDEDELKSLKAKKFENEQRALISICGKLGPEGNEIMSLWLRFETSEDEAATLARQIDKYQAIEKALEYERAQGVPLFQEFLEYDRKRVIHPVLVKRLAQLEQEFNTRQR